MKKLTVSMDRQEVYTGWAYFLFELLIFPFLLSMGNQLLSYPVPESTLNVLYFCLNFFFILVIFHRFLWTSLKKALQEPWPLLKCAFLGFALYQISSTPVTFAIQTLMPDFSNVNDTSIYALLSDNSLLLRLAIVLFVPVVEETLHRGLLFRGLYEQSPIAAYAISTILFSVIHILAHIGSYEPLHLFLCFVQYLPAGLCLAWAYARADNICAPILMHIAINQIGLTAMR